MDTPRITNLLPRPKPITFPKYRYTILLEGGGASEAEAARRLARLLKIAWRAYSLRCASVTDGEAIK